MRENNVGIISAVGSDADGCPIHVVSSHILRITPLIRMHTILTWVLLDGIGTTGIGRTGTPAKAGTPNLPAMDDTSPSPPGVCD